jgi:hypothetical protein
MLSEIVIETAPGNGIVGTKRHVIEKSAGCVSTNDAVTDSRYALVTVEAVV